MCDQINIFHKKIVELVENFIELKGYWVSNQINKTRIEYLH